MKGIMRTVVVILGLSAGVTGCRGSESIAGSPVTPSAPSGSQPQITAIAPSAISTAGLAWGTIMGSRSHEADDERIEHPVEAP